MPPVTVTLTPENELPAWRVVVKRAVAVLLSGLLLYVLAPVLIKVVSVWPRLSSLRPAWTVVGLVVEAGSFTCTFFLKRIALRTRAILAVITSALVGNAVTNVLPGGDATGATIEFSLLSTSGVETGAAVGGLTATALLQTGCLLALPVLTLPTILAGAPVSRGLVHLVFLGLAMFALYAVGAFGLFQTDEPLRLIGRIVQRLHNSLLRRRRPITDLPDRLLRERNSTRRALGTKWWQALLFATGRVLLDFACLLAMLAATRTRPEPSLVLIAYVATTVVALLPLTPGGLGLVEGSLTGLLVLAGVPAAKAVLSTLAYRVASYWFPTFAGPIAYVIFRSRYRSGQDHNDTLPTEGGSSARQ